MHAEGLLALLTGAPGEGHIAQARAIYESLRSRGRTWD